MGKHLYNDKSTEIMASTYAHHYTPQTTNKTPFKATNQPHPPNNFTYSNLDCRQKETPLSSKTNASQYSLLGHCAFCSLHTYPLPFASTFPFPFLFPFTFFATFSVSLRQRNLTTCIIFTNMQCNAIILLFILLHVPPIYHKTILFILFILEQPHSSSDLGEPQLHMLIHKETFSHFNSLTTTVSTLFLLFVSKILV